MHITRRLAVPLLALTMIVSSVVVGSRHISSATSAYVDPTLLAAHPNTLSVIVAATDSHSAAQAVERVGGHVTSDLWLARAVAAQLSATQLRALAAYPGIRAITTNQSVHSSDNSCSGSGSCQERPGWMTDRRKKKGAYDIYGTQPAPASFLPDGSFVSIAENGKLLFVKANGRVRARIDLGVSGFKSAPAIGNDGTVYLAREDKQIYAVAPSGTTRWIYTHTERFLAGVVLGRNGTVYAADEKRNLLALNPSTGQIVWRVRIGPDQAGSVNQAPTVGPDGTIYLASAADPSYVFALNPAGVLIWSFIAPKGAPISFSPIGGTSNLLYLASSEKLVLALDAATGSLTFSFPTTSRILAPPAVGGDGSVYVAAEDRTLYGVNPDGTQRFAFRPVSGHFKTSPVLSPDERTVYAALEEKTLFALATASGAEQWRYTTIGNLKASPVLDGDGNLMFGSEGDDFVTLNPAGTPISQLDLSDRIVQAISANADGDALVRVGDHKLVRIGRLPSQWEGGPDVEPTELKREWILSNPLPIDLGADKLHDRGITGQGVTVAVLDSGVYFNKHVEDILGTNLDQQYLGQADFVGTGVCSGPGKQFNGYCFSDHHNSIDRYGHGSHVAGIVWSQIIDYATGVRMGVAPDANILSVRVLNENGEGTYADVIEGLQYVVANKATFNIRVLNLSLSANADVPYFVDPLNRAVEQAWARGIVVLAAAGNTGPGAETITAPGNDPYVITIGAINDNRTPGYWSDDIVPSWSATGPTHDGFAKPDVLAPGSNVISFMYTDKNDSNSATLARLHPDYIRTVSLFRMNGTSMATAAASSVVALMLQANPNLTPDQVKFRLLVSARPALSVTSDAVYNTLQQGMGRIWAPDAVLGRFPIAGTANADMDINADLSHGWTTAGDLAYHYQGPIRSMLSDDGSAYLYYVTDDPDGVTALGVARPDGTWIDYDTMASARMTWAGARMTWAGGMTWAGSTDAFASARMTWAGARMTWAGARMTWAGARMTWASARMTWAGARMTWAGGMTWAGSTDAFASARMTWAGNMKTSSTDVSSTTWVGDW